MRDVVQEPALAIHGYCNALRDECFREGRRGELSALVGVEYLRLAIQVHGLLQGLDAQEQVRRFAMTDVR